MNTQASKNQTKTRGAVIYTRVSTGEQDKHGTRPETQRDACRAKALALGLPIIAEYYDGGISGGFLLARTGMQSALADIKAGQADTLICANISRYSRDAEHQQAIKKAVKTAGGRLVFCDMDFDDTPEGDLAFGIMGGFAEYEKAVIKKRSISGHHKRAEEGIQTARFRTPYGFIIPTHADITRGTNPTDHLGRYLVVEEKAVVVRELFARYAAGGHSLTDLCRRLNKEGIPPPSKSRMWQISTLRYILANPVYKGQAVYGRFDHGTDEGRLGQCDPQTGRPLRTLKTRQEADPATWITIPCPVIVPEEIWESVQVRLKQNQAALSGNPRQVRMLTGRIVCPLCGSGMQCSTPGRRKRADGSVNILAARYVCTRYRFGIAHKREQECSSEGFIVPEVEQAVVLALPEAGVGSSGPGSLHTLAGGPETNHRYAAGDCRRSVPWKSGRP